MADENKAAAGAGSGRRGFLGRRRQARPDRPDPDVAKAAPVAPEIPRPLHADWAWRPEAWSRALAPAALVMPRPGTRLGAELAVFHDCPVGEMAVRQRPGGAGVPQIVEIEVGAFAGRFLSLAIDLPGPALDGLSAGHILAVTARYTADTQVSGVSRLNLRQGPEQRQMTRGLPPGRATEFDLFAAGLDHRRIEAGWIDLIFEAPYWTRIEIADLTLTRRPRAAF